MTLSPPRRRTVAIAIIIVIFGMLLNGITLYHQGACSESALPTYCSLMEPAYIAAGFGFGGILYAISLGQIIEQMPTFILAPLGLVINSWPYFLIATILICNYFYRKIAFYIKEYPPRRGIEKHG